MVFVVVGEALVDLAAQRGSRTFVAHPGGSPANVALALARLENPVTLVTQLGRDAFGELIAAHLRDSGVRLAREPDPGVRTSLAVATLAAGSASYDFRIEWDIRDLDPLPLETAACTPARWRPHWPLAAARSWTSSSRSGEEVG